MKKFGGYIPGIRPGQRTAEYIDRVLSRITLGGALYVSAVCVLPTILIQRFNVPFYFGGTALLIVVGVALDTIAQMETHMLTRSYQGFMRRGRMRGRRGCGEVARRAVILIGPPGAGKGTQASCCRSDFGYRTSPLEICCAQAVERKTAKRVCRRRPVHGAGRVGSRRRSWCADRGTLAPGRLRDGFIARRIPAQRRRRPRCWPRCSAARSRGWMPVDEHRRAARGVVRRLSGRRTCRNCGAMYHVHLRSAGEPRVVRTSVNGELYQRDDDSEETIRARLEVYAARDGAAAASTIARARTACTRSTASAAASRCSSAS